MQIKTEKSAQKARRNERRKPAPFRRRNRIRAADIELESICRAVRALSHHKRAPDILLIIGAKKSYAIGLAPIFAYIGFSIAHFAQIVYLFFCRTDNARFFTTEMLGFGCKSRDYLVE